MSVVILGMEMPENCHECRLCMQEAGTELGVCAYCGLTGFGWEAYSDRPDWCPLRPLPKRHGALIDRDALLKQKGDCYDHDGHLLYAVGTGNILCAPTIVEAEGDGDEL